MKDHSAPFVPIQLWPPIRRFRVYDQTARWPDWFFDSQSRSTENFTAQGGEFSHQFRAQGRQALRREHNSQPTGWVDSPHYSSGEVICQCGVGYFCGGCGITGLVGACVLPSIAPSPPQNFTLRVKITAAPINSKRRQLANPALLGILQMPDNRWRHRLLVSSLLLLLLALAISSMATHRAQQREWTRRQAIHDSLIKGESKQADVLALLGSPYRSWKKSVQSNKTQIKPMKGTTPVRLIEEVIVVYRCDDRVFELVFHDGVFVWSSGIVTDKSDISVISWLKKLLP